MWKALRTMLSFKEVKIVPLEDKKPTKEEEKQSNAQSIQQVVLSTVRRATSGKDKTEKEKSEKDDTDNDRTEDEEDSLSTAVETSTRSSSSVSTFSSVEAARAFHTKDQKYGERISDDALYTFCDRVKESMKEKIGMRKVEGWISMNTMLVLLRMHQAELELEEEKKNPNSERLKDLESEVKGVQEHKESIRKELTGKHPIVQMLFDPHRMHYVVAYFSPRRDSVLFFDSLIPPEGPHFAVDRMGDQLQLLFGHLFTNGTVRVRVPLEYFQQKDTWSCGLRALACFRDLVLGRNPLGTDYDVGAAHELLIDCLSMKEIEWKKIEEKRLHKGHYEVEKDQDTYPLFTVDKEWSVSSNEKNGSKEEIESEGG